MIRIAIVEDDRVTGAEILAFTRRYERENDLEFIIEEFADGQEIIDYQAHGFDIIFFDIDLPVKNGMEAAREIRKRNENVIIIFITNLESFAIQGYSVGALDYVLKPINYYGFSLRLTRALERLRQKAAGEILLQSADQLIRLNTDDIYYVEISNRMLYYYTKQGEYVIRGSMKEAERQLEDFHFAKCNHWYLVNLKYVKGIVKNTVTVGKYELEISRRNKSAFVKAVTDYIGGGL